MSVRSLRDAELEIEALKRSHNDLVRQLKDLKLNSNNTSNGAKAPQVVRETVEVNEVDSQLNADQNTVIHQLLHMFERIKTDKLETTDISFTGSVTGQKLHLHGPDDFQIHFSDDLTEQGGYIRNAGNVVQITVGANWDTANWIARNTTAAMIVLAGGTAFRFFLNTGLTIGATVPWTKIFEIPIGLSATNPLKLDSSKVLTCAPIDLASSEVTGVLPLAKGGAAGITAAFPITYNVGVAFDTINYKDHTGANATKSVVINVAPLYRNSQFTNGLLAS